MSTQKKQVQLLGVERFFDSIIYAREVGVGREKPDPEAYRLMLKALGVGAEETICVGDNPFTDFLGAKALGIRTVRLQSGEFRDVYLSREHEADVTIDALVQVINLVNKFNNTGQ